MVDATMVMGSALKERLAFETMLSDLSARFINFESSAVDREIENAQRRVCECLDLDISALWQWAIDDPGHLTMTHLHRPPGGPPMPERMVAHEAFPWCLEQILAGRTIVLPDIEASPPEAATDRATFRFFGAASALAFGLLAEGGRIFGALSFHSIHGPHHWPEETIQRLRLVAQIFANVLVRKRGDAALLESEERLKLAADSGQTGMWELSIESGDFWATDRARELFGYGPDTDVTLEMVLESVHTEWRDPVKKAIRRAAEDGHEINIEFRIVLTDGEERWIYTRGRLQEASAANPRRLIGASIDVTQRKRAEAHQLDRFRFERLLADLSTRVLSAPTDAIDAAIGTAQRLVCDHLDIDLSALWQWSPDNPDSQTLSHIYKTCDGPPIPDSMDARENLSWSLDQILAGRIVAFSSVDDAPPEAATSKESWLRLGVKSTLILPLTIGGEPAIGSLSFNTLKAERQWPDDVVQRLRSVAEVFANALKRKQSEEQLRRSCAEIEKLQRQLELENAYLRSEYQVRFGNGRIIGESPAIMKVLEMAERVAPNKTTVLIEGETGVGKELVAQRLHELSPRGDRPLVKVNCAALPSNLVESELFGHEKGAYTGALTREAGRFEVANGSTIFLDEIAELPFELQAKLLRVLEEGSFERVGSSKTLKTDVRVIAATNRDLRAEVEAGRFRKDLFFRLAVFPILVPPLRERQGDVPLLVWSIVQELGGDMKKSIESIRRGDMERLQRHEWPGNVRELRNVVERAMILCSGPELRFILPQGPVHEEDTVLLPMDEVQRRHIIKVLEVTEGQIRGSAGAADVLGMNPSTLRSRMRSLGLDPAYLRNGTSHPEERKT